MKKAQALVLERVVAVGLVAGRLVELRAELRQRLGAEPLAAQAVDEPAARRHRQPGGRVARHARRAPGVERLEPRVLQGFLAALEVAAAREQRRQDATVLLAQGRVQARRDVVGRRAVRIAQAGSSPISQIGRISIAPSTAMGTFCAQASAASRSSTSIR